ncbi:phage minor tail protein L [Escherichia coli]|uniref:phage minor tail protein L n=1 Tax=Escherichia coli TaxID=562 RepID=UPI00388EC076
MQRTERGECLFCTVHADGNGWRCFSGTYHAGQHLHRTYRGDECGYHGPAVADEYDQPTSDITKDKCSKCLSGCKFRNNVGNFGGFLSINKLSQ